jgi:hypothetical protein
MDTLIRELVDNEFEENKDWLISDGKLWVSPETNLFIVEDDALDELLVNVWDPQAGPGTTFSKPAQTYYYAWKNNEKRATLHKRELVVLARGAMNSALVKFIDNGQQEIISRNALRKVKI